MEGLWIPPATAISTATWLERANQFRLDSRVGDHWLTLGPVKDIPNENQLKAVHEIGIREAMADLRAALLMEPVGKGKTQIVLLYILREAQARYRAGGARFGHPTLIVVPLKLLPQWERYIRDKYTSETFSIESIAETREILDPAAKARIEWAMDIVLTTYESLRAAAAGAAGSTPLPGLFSVPWHRIVLEEATAVSNKETLVFQAISLLRTTYRLAVTATPIPNSRLDELVTMLRTLDCRSLATDPIRDARDASDRLVPYIVAVTRRVVRTPDKRWLPFLTEGERALYQEVEEEARRSAPNTLAALRILCQLSLSPALLMSRAERAMLPAERPAFTKIAYLLRYVEEEMAVDEKGVVFAFSKTGLHELQHHLARAGVGAVLVTGDDPVPVRNRLMREFVRLPTTVSKLMLCTYKTVNLGTDGLQQVANHVLEFEPSWVPTDDEQACGRLDRPGASPLPDFMHPVLTHPPGQTRPVHFVKFILKGTVDVHMDAICERKKQRNGEYFDSARESVGVEEIALDEGRWLWEEEGGEEE